LGTVLVVTVVLTNPLSLGPLLQLLAGVSLAYFSTFVWHVPAQHIVCAEVTDVVQKSPAAEAGLEPSMSICQVNEYNIATAHGLRALPSFESNDVLNLTLCNGTVKHLVVDEVSPRIGLTLQCEGVTRGFL